MDLDPQKFFIGLMDFFSILLPGALLTWLLMDAGGPAVLGPRYDELTGAQAWAGFLVASYLFGHLIFLLGSWLDEFYGWARGYTLDKQIKELARHGRVPYPPIRALIWLLFKGERNLAVNCAMRIKEQILGPLQASDTVNAFQWSKALLTVESPESLAVVHRFEADSKFFRCFVVLLLILLAAWPWQHRWPPAGIFVVLTLLTLALWRYVDQRHKASNRAYWSIIALTAKNGTVTLNSTAPVPPDPTHAGGVVFRVKRGSIKYLLVEAKDDPAQWVLPKGHVESGEHHREAAVREVREEAGVWARIEEEIETANWSVEGVDVKTRFYLMRAIGNGLKQDRDRRPVWLSLTEAIDRASHRKTKELLGKADARVGKLLANGPSKGAFGTGSAS